MSTDAECRTRRRRVRLPAVTLTALALALTLPLAAAAGPKAAKPRPGGAVRMPSTEPTCMNPVNPVCDTGANYYHFWITQHVLLGAFELGRDWTYRPRLVSHVEVRRKPFTLTYHIRPQARWSDGTPVTARDFVFTHEWVVRDRPRDRQGLHAEVREIRAVGPKTVRVVLRRPDASWRGALFGWVYPHHVLSRERDLLSVWRQGIDDPRTGRPIGTGPFLFSQWRRGRDITLVRNPNYWDRKAHLDRIVFRFPPPDLRPGATVLDGLFEGELDFAYVTPTPDELERLQRNPRFKFRGHHGPELEQLVVRTGPGGHPALRSAAVRRALFHAIDREALVRALYPTLRPRVQVHDSLLYTVHSPYYRRNFGIYRHRGGAGPREARRLLEAAGCRRGSDGIYACAGRRLTLRAVTRTGMPFRIRTLTILQEQLAAIGVELVPTYYANRVVFDTVLPGGEWDLALYAVNMGPVSRADGAWGCGGPFNWMGYCNRQVTRNLAQANEIVDLRLRARALNAAEAQLARDAPALPLYHWSIMLVYKRELRGVAWRPYRFNVEGWWLERSR